VTRRSLVGAGAAAFAFQVADDIAGLSIEDAAALIRRKRLSPVELVQRCLSRMEMLNPKLNAFITITGDQALAQARELEAEQARGKLRGPMHGIPVGVKDLFDTAGVRTTSASALRADRVPQRDSDVVARLRRAGAVLVGKCNMDEFAYNFTGETSHFGVCRNPWKPTHTPGGSSGGSAVAVAARMCLGTVGSDTGGSIRLPAAFCGIVGLKPTYGLVPLGGATPLAWSMDHAGPMARTVEGVALMLAAMADARFALTPQVRKLRIGVPRKPYFERLSAEMASAMEEALRVLGGVAGAVVEMSLPEVAPSVIVRAEALAHHEANLAADAGRMHPHTVHEIREGEKVSLAAYARSIGDMVRLRGIIGQVFRDVDAVAMPTAIGAAFALDPSRAPDLVYLRNTIPINILGIPAVSVPCGFGTDGLPLGLQLCGPAGGEATLLSLTRAYEKAAGWVGRPGPPDPSP
jgi:aspartyl-tRNA(Asn)/glutamyl-tRNA(Gln) amidotransferase subunit A